MAKKSAEPLVPYNIEGRSDTEKQLFALQTKYFNSKRNQKYWVQMLEIIYPYAKSILLKKQRGKGYMEPEIVNDYAMNAAILFMRQYLNNLEFNVVGSFYGMLNFKVVEARYKHNKEDLHDSLDRFIDESNSNSITLEEAQVSVGFKNILEDTSQLGNPESILQVNEPEVIEAILHELDMNENVDIKTLLLVRFYLILCLRKPKNRHSKKMFLQNWCRGSNFKVEQIIDLAMLELHTRINSYK